MSGSETTPESDPTIEMHPAVDVSELEAARAALGRERTHAARSFRDKEGYTKLNNDPTSFDDEEKRNLTGAEFTYFGASREALIEKAKELKESGATYEEMRQQLAVFMEEEQTQRLQAEIEAKLNPDTKIGKLKLRLVEGIRNHPKLRLATGLALTGAAIGATVASAGGFAVAAIGARAALSAAGVYVGVKDLQEVAGNHAARSEGKWWNRNKPGKLVPLTDEQIDKLGDDERLKHISRLLAVQARSIRTGSQGEGDDATLEKLRGKERDAIEGRLAEKYRTHHGDALVKGAVDVLDQRVAEQLAAERKQLIHDKKVNRRRTFIAGTAAATLASYSLVAGIGHEAASLHHHTPNSAPAHGGGAVSPEGGVVAPEHAAVPGEVHPNSFAHYPENVTDNFDKGDTPVRVAMKHLSRIQGWSHFSADQQHEKIMHFANQLTRHGDNWHYTKEAIQASYNFDHGAVEPNHFIPGPDHIAPSGKTELILPQGVDAPASTHELVLGADSPEIVTQQVHWGDTATGIARHNLSRLPGWSDFSPTEQHDKIVHFASQIKNNGDSWRYTKEAIQASYNFKR